MRITPEAGTEIVVTRHAADGGEIPVDRVPVSRLINQADPAVNFALHGGEEIRVPEAGKIFVVGNVRRPGAFPVRDAEGFDSSRFRCLLGRGSDGKTPASHAGKRGSTPRRSTDNMGSWSKGTIPAWRAGDPGSSPGGSTA